MIDKSIRTVTGRREVARGAVVLTWDLELALSLQEGRVRFDELLRLQMRSVSFSSSQNNTLKEIDRNRQYTILSVEA